MTEENKTSVLARVREWITAHPIVTGIVAGTAAVLTAQLVAQRLTPEAVGSDPAPEIENAEVE